MPTARTARTDHGCLWFRGLPAELVHELEPMAPGDAIALTVNGSPTRWVRMNAGAGRPTRGLRIVDGNPHWEAVPMRAEFELGWDTGPGVAAPLVAPLAPRDMPKRDPASGSLFDEYVFADYSGAADPTQQKKAIRVAHAIGAGDAVIVPQRLTRRGLLDFQLALLQRATREGDRVALGQDHQFGFPRELLDELGLANLTWREYVARLVEGGYGPSGDGPALGATSTYCAELNAHLKRQGKAEYFWSATKATRYGIPSSDPRKAAVGAWRRTERYPSIFGRGSPKPLGRVGDNGSVGAQTLAGLAHLHELVRAAGRLGIPLKVWPMDGIDLGSSVYRGAHVLFEPYPSASRELHIDQTDADDAVAATVLVRGLDRRGTLLATVDLSPLGDTEKEHVLAEGWIVGHTTTRPPSPRW